MKTYSFEDGKYEVDRDEETSFILSVRRHGEYWPIMFEQVKHQKMFHAILNHIDSLESAERVAVPGAVPEEWRRVIHDPDLYELLMNVQNGINHIGIEGWANRAIIRIDKARAATPPQQATPAEPDARQFLGWAYKGTAPHTKDRLILQAKRAESLEHRWWAEIGPVYVTQAASTIAAAQPDALSLAMDALEEIALAGMSGSGQESEEGMQAWHARRAWEFIGIAARATTAIRAALATRQP